MPAVKRLYKDFQPLEYSLDLHLNNLTDRQFSGTVTITGIQKKPNAIRLHAKDLKVTAVVFDAKLTNNFKLEGDELVISHKQVGKTTFTISFLGQITDPMHGLYPCYFKHNGQKKQLLATQFESHHAREVFPCIDEPEAKATFDLTLITKDNVAVLGNTPVKEQASSEIGLTTTFETTPRMSPYLLAFVVGDLHSLAGQTKGGVQVNVWATPNQPKESLKFALKTSVKAIEFFEDYFGTPYPLKKCDHVALPDFSSGAMENWGLITYREICLLTDRSTSQSVKQYVALVICHELAHQWFGNLVTMKWWDDLWLNESFATLMEYVAVDQLFPTWDIWTDFTASEGLSALKRDALPGVQSVKTKVNHPDEISSLFDGSIVYAKGARLLNMLLHYLGETKFRSGLKKYFKKFAYANTVGDDLWQTLGGQPITELMQPWLTQPGYPVLEIKDQAGKLNLAQRRLILDFENKNSIDVIWPVPLFRKSGDKALFHSKTTLVPASRQLTRFNLGGNGHYVLHYLDQIRQDQLAQQIKDGLLNPSERLAYLNGSLLLSQAGLASITEVLDNFKVFKTEPSEPVWTSLAGIIGELKRLCEDHPATETDLKSFVANLIAPSFKRLGWQAKSKESGNDIKLRGLIIGLGVWSETPTILNLAFKAFSKTSNLADLPTEIRSSILAANVRHGQNQAFTKLLQAYLVAGPELQQDIVGALAATRKQAEIKTYLSKITNSKFVRPQEVDRWLVYALRNPAARNLAWQWLVDHWDWIEKLFKGDKSYDNYPRYAGACFSSSVWLKKYVNFFESLKQEPALKRNIQLGEAEIKARIHWQQRDLPALTKFLNKS